ncbi:MAG TPA: hypothetical protein VG944_10925 [Fimbriimonas sp.]|nr:hypothetical protein [Fimbriimonas sp.]
MNRFLTCITLAFAGLTVSAFGQATALTAPGTILATPYTNVFQGGIVQMQMTGTESIDVNRSSATTPIQSVLYWESGTDPRTNLPSLVKIELDDYDPTRTDATGRNPLLLRRFVGDGEYLWCYDLTRKTFTTTFYSFFASKSSTPPASDAPRLFQALYPQTSGHLSYMVRLLRDAFGQNYESWAPDSQACAPPFAPETVNDPLTNRPYSNSSGESWLLYGPLDDSPTRTVAFQTDNLGSDTDPNWQLTHVYFAEEVGKRSSNLAISISSGIYLSGTSPVFVPYSAQYTQGWRQLTTSKPFSG